LYVGWVFAKICWGRNLQAVIPEAKSNNIKSEKIRIMLADDHPLVRQALRGLLEKQPDFEIVAEAKDGEEAVDFGTRLVPDVVIMDISMPKMNGLEATKQIKKVHPNVAVLVLTIHTDTEYILSLLQNGAGGYLTKKVYGDEIIHAIRSIVAGEAVLDPSVMQQILKHAFQHMTKPINLDTGDKLSARELETLRLLAKGISNKDIADRLGVGLRSVKGYLGDLFLKLGVASRTEAVVISLRKGILTINDLD
jgi:NarL family two-component system response regulator LiaR